MRIAGQKEIEIEKREKEYRTQRKGGAVLRESGLVERAVLVGRDGGIEGTNHGGGREQELERVRDIPLIP